MTNVVHYEKSEQNEEETTETKKREVFLKIIFKCLKKYVFQSWNRSFVFFPQNFIRELKLRNVGTEPQFIWHNWSIVRDAFRNEDCDKGLVLGNADFEGEY